MKQTNTNKKVFYFNELFHVLKSTELGKFQI